jgi:hypothetical protein
MTVLAQDGGHGMRVEQELTTATERERQQAALRVGQTPLARMQWILNFVQQDDERLSAGDVLNEQHEMLALMQKPMRWKRGGRFWRWIGSPTELPTPDHLRELRRDWRRTIENMLNMPPGQQLHVPMPMEIIYRRGEPLSMRSTARVGEGAGVYMVMSLMEDFAPMTRRCEDCKRLYVAVRRRQQFCSRRCQNRVFIREKRGAPATAPEQATGSSSKKVRTRRSAGASRGVTTRA